MEKLKIKNVTNKITDIIKIRQILNLYTNKRVTLIHLIEYFILILNHGNKEEKTN